jgi:hypothetical protein
VLPWKYPVWAVALEAAMIASVMAHEATRNLRMLVLSRKDHDWYPGWRGRGPDQVQDGL